MRSAITTHVLDTAHGRPAAGIDVVLELATSGGFEPFGRGRTDGDGRVGDLLAPGLKPRPGTYRLTFEVGPYLEASGAGGFYARIPIEFSIVDADQHYHVPLLLSPFGYSTYRGS